MTSDETKVQELLDDLKAKRDAAESALYDSFFKAPLEIQELYYQYWVDNCGAKTPPRFLQDYEKAKEPSPPVFLWPPVPF